MGDVALLRPLDFLQATCLTSIEKLDRMWGKWMEGSLTQLFSPKFE